MPELRRHWDTVAQGTANSNSAPCVKLPGYLFPRASRRFIFIQIARRSMIDQRVLISHRRCALGIYFLADADFNCGSSRERGVVEEAPRERGGEASRDEGARNSGSFEAQFRLSNR